MTRSDRQFLQALKDLEGYDIYDCALCRVFEKLLNILPWIHICFVDMFPSHSTCKSVWFVSVLCLRLQHCLKMSPIDSSIAELGKGNLLSESRWKWWKIFNKLCKYTEHIHLSCFFIYLQNLFAKLLSVCKMWSQRNVWGKNTGVSPSKHQNKHERWPEVEIILLQWQSRGKYISCK